MYSPFDSIPLPTLDLVPYLLASLVLFGIHSYWSLAFILLEYRLNANGPLNLPTKLIQVPRRQGIDRFLRLGYNLFCK